MAADLIRVLGKYVSEPDPGKRSFICLNRRPEAGTKGEGRLEGYLEDDHGIAVKKASPAKKKAKKKTKKKASKKTTKKAAPAPEPVVEEAVGDTNE